MYRPITFCIEYIIVWTKYETTRLKFRWRLNNFGYNFVYTKRFARYNKSAVFVINKRPNVRGELLTQQIGTISLIKQLCTK